MATEMQQGKAARDQGRCHECAINLPLQRIIKHE
jgi:hypothetical protein